MLRGEEKDNSIEERVRAKQGRRDESLAELEIRVAIVSMWEEKMVAHCQNIVMIYDTVS